MKKKFVQGFAISAMTAALAACGGGGDGDDAAATGSVSVGMADAPIDNVDEVNITVTGVVLKPAGGDKITFEFDEPKSLNLLDLQNGNVASLIEDEEVPAGEYNWIRLMLSDNPDDLNVMIGDAIYTLEVPSGSQTGLKLNTGFTVPAGGDAAFTIDFDVRKSLVEPVGNSADYFLKPSLRLIDNIEVGTLTGTVDSSTIIQTECADSQTYAGAVYVYNGTDVTPDDLGSANEPLVVVPVNEDVNEPGTYTYTNSFIAEGDYTVSYTCDMDELTDDNGEPLDEDLNFIDTQNTSVTAGETTTVNFVGS
ncbi:DUF4382 domain-containing protein [Marinobacter mangrovi]|uniref:DUF4382 domain-containing protein n=1 Tax=Marinobacter mangrovi TaxID=2803918 RepID=UPI001934658F|nr:DUF4382 domain-containing protein [Marinobacter mangrovi]